MSEPPTITPRVDHIRVLMANVEFSPYVFERIVSIPNLDGALLLDIGIRISCGPLVSLDHKIALCPHDVHVILEFNSNGTPQSIDLTEALKFAIRRELDTLDQSVLQLQYRSALDQWLATIAALSKRRRRWHTRHVKTSVEKAVAEKLLSNVPLSGNLDLFGNRTAGLQGRLHISNFIYRQIDLKAVSLNSLISMSQSGNQPENAKNVSIGAFANPKIVCRHGAKGITTIADIDDEPVPAGVVDLSLECVYHNDLEDEFDDLEHKIKSRLLEIHKKLIGDIQQDLANTQDELQDALDSLSKVTTFGVDFKAQLSSIEQNLQSIQSKVAGLK